MGSGTDDKNYLKNLDTQIKELEERQGGSALGLSEEKKVIAEISKLQNSKKLYKSFQDLNEAIKESETKISGHEVELGKIKERADIFFSKRNADREVINASDNKIDAVQAEIVQEQAARTVLNDKITALRTQQTVVKNELKEFRDKRRESRQAEYERTKQERQAEYERVKQQRQAENQRRTDDRKQKELKRIQEELEQEPYSEELELCIQLIKYLEPFVPKVPKVAVEGETGAESPKPAATTPPPVRENGPEGTALVREEEDNRPLNKRNKKKPQKVVDLEKELRHNVETFLQFEKVSIVPPAKVAEVEKTVGQLKEKKVYYQKRAEEKLQKKKAELEAEAKAIKNPQSTSSSTTTTTSEEESKETSDETPADE